jgi:hypothetical protein
MKVCSFKGIEVVVLLRDEHCPPHVHAGTSDWDARFEFSFWHTSVSLMDVKPAAKAPKASQLEAVRLVVEDPRNLARAREIWWSKLGTICLENKCWDPNAQEIVDPKVAGKDAVPIEPAVFDSQANTTIIKLYGEEELVEIVL